MRLTANLAIMQKRKREREKERKIEREREMGGEGGGGGWMVANALRDSNRCQENSIGATATHNSTAAVALNCKSAYHWQPLIGHLSMNRARFITAATLNKVQANNSPSRSPAKISPTFSSGDSSVQLQLVGQSSPVVARVD